MPSYHGPITQSGSTIFPAVLAFFQHPTCPGLHKATCKSLVTITAHQEYATVRALKAVSDFPLNTQDLPCESTHGRARSYRKSSLPSLMALLVSWILLWTTGLYFMPRIIPCFSWKLVSNTHSHCMSNKICRIWREVATIISPPYSTPLR